MAGLGEALLLHLLEVLVGEDFEKDMVAGAVEGGGEDVDEDGELFGASGLFGEFLDVVLGVGVFPELGIVFAFELEGAK